MHHTREVLSFVLVLFSSSACVAGPGIRFEKKTYRPGDRVHATITANGTVGIENDIEQLSRSVKINGSAKVDLGVIRKPGIYTVRAIRGNQATVAVVLASPSGGSLRFDVTTRPANKPPKLSPNILRRFTTGLTKARLKKAGEQALKNWLPGNAAAVGATATFCTICVVPGGQAACAPCVTSGKANFISLSVEFVLQLISIMKEEGILTPNEASVISNVVRFGNGIYSIRNAGDKLAKTLEALKVGTDVAVEHEGVKAVVSNGVDEIGKARLMIKVFTK